MLFSFRISQKETLVNIQTSGYTLWLEFIVLLVGKKEIFASSPKVESFQFHVFEKLNSYLTPSHIWLELVVFK